MSFPNHHEGFISTNVGGGKRTHIGAAFIASHGCFPSPPAVSAKRGDHSTTRMPAAPKRAHIGVETNAHWSPSRPIPAVMSGSGGAHDGRRLTLNVTIGPRASVIWQVSPTQVKRANCLDSPQMRRPPQSEGTLSTQMPST